MRKVHLTNRSGWRRWLAKNHDREEDGVWLVFHKKTTGKPSLEYEDAVEEALCFGWIDSIVKKIDDERYCRKFTPRKQHSRWSSINKRRVAKVIKAGIMTEFGLVKVDAAKQSGQWEMDSRPTLNMETPKEWSAALARNKRAKEYFETLAPSYKKQYIAWIVTAKKPETKMKRIRESMALLAKRMKLGIK